MIQLAENDIRDLTSLVTTSVLGLEAEAAPVLSSIGTDGSVTACVHIGGDWEGAIAVSCSTALARRVASQMFEIPEQQVALAEIKDALGELGNMIGGSVKGLLPGSCRLSLPMVAEGRDYSLSVPGTVRMHELWSACAGEPLLVRVLRRARVSDLA